MDVPRTATRLMANRRAAVLAWSIVAVCFGLAATAIVMGVLNPPSKNVDQWGGSNIISGLSFVLPMLVAPVLGGLIAARRPKSPIGWILIVTGLGWMLTAFHDTFLAYWEHSRGHAPPVIDWVSLVGWLPSIAGLGTFLLLLFPDGKLPSKRWRPVLWLCIVMVAVCAPVVALSPTNPGQPVVGIPNLLRPLVPLATKLSATLFLLPVCIVLCVASLFVRYRRATFEDRVKLRWIAFGALVGMLYFVTTMLVSALWDRPGSSFQPIARVLQSGTFFAIALIPVSIGFAVLRYKLYEIDRIISRTVSYVLVTVVLAGIYILVVLGPTTILGSGRGAPPWLVAMGTLAVAVLFSPVRGRFQRSVDHRFNRKRYDAARILGQFTARLREQVDLDELQPALEDVVKQTMQPATVRLWLASPAPVTSS